DGNPGWLGGTYTLEGGPSCVPSTEWHIPNMFCLDRTWYNEFVYRRGTNLLNATWHKAYQDIVPQVFMAVHDTVTFKEDVLRGGINARPANLQGNTADFQTTFQPSVALPPS